MTRERSAGFVVFRTDPSAPDGRVYLLLDYGKHWDLPKGHVEKGEDDQTTAMRELAEETGIVDARPIDGFTREITYWFRHRRKGLIHKEVVFFLAETSQTQVKLSEEHKGSIWLSLDDAIKKLTYPNAQRLLQAAAEFLASR